MFSSASSEGRLTIDAVQTIVANSILTGQYLTLQLLQPNSNYLGHHQYFILLLIFSAELSDGYAKVKCELRGKIKIMVEQQQVKDYSVISVGKDDIEVTGDHERVDIIVSNCTVVNAQVSKLIGEPMPFNLYKKNVLIQQKLKNYQNPKGNNEIDTTPRHYTIRQVVNNTRLRNAHLRARVTKFPQNIVKGILCFKVQDEQERQIQCVSYDEMALQLFSQIKYGGQYLFSGFVLQKNKVNNEDELKFRKDGKVISVHNANTNTNTTNNGGQLLSTITAYNNNNNQRIQQKQRETSSKIVNKKSEGIGFGGNPVMRQQQQRGQQQQHQKQNVSNQTQTINKRKLISVLSTSLEELQKQQSNKNKSNQILFTLEGRVTFLMQKSKHRKVNIMDDNDDIIDLLLWEEVKEKIEKEKCYQFTCMRIKITPQIEQGNYKYIELHSTKKTKVIEVNPERMENNSKRANMATTGNSTTNNNNNQFNNTNKQRYQQQQNNNNQRKIDKNEHKETTKRLPDHVVLNKLSDLLEIRQNGNQAKEKLASPYPFVECTLKFRTEGFAFNNSDEIMNYFSFFCGSCNKSTSAILSENNVVSCNRCKRDDVMVKWSLRVKALDMNFQLPCSLQSQTTERLLNMKGYDGFVLYNREFSKFQTLLHKVNFERRVCKFQIRQKEGNQYYNVLEVYAKDTKLQVYNAVARLKERISSFQQPKQTRQQLKEEKIQIQQ